MKKLAALLMIFSLGLINVGCQPADEADTVDSVEEEVEDPAADPDAADPAADEGEVEGAG